MNSLSKRLGAGATLRSRAMTEPAHRDRHRRRARHRRRRRQAPRRRRVSPSPSLDLDESACAGQSYRDRGRRAARPSPSVSTSPTRPAVQAAVERVAAELGAPTVLVNNAGIIRDNLLFKMTADDWDAVMNVHLRGSFLMTRADAEAHDRRRSAAASSTSLAPRRSATAARPTTPPPRPACRASPRPSPSSSASSASPPTPSRPGFIATDMTAPDRRAHGHRPSSSSSRARPRQIPVARVGQPEDIAATASFLVREEAGFVSGQVIYVAGGPKD